MGPKSRRTNPSFALKIRASGETCYCRLYIVAATARFVRLHMSMGWQMPLLPAITILRVPHQISLFIFPRSTGCNSYPDGFRSGAIDIIQHSLLVVALLMDSF